MTYVAGIFKWQFDQNRFQFLSLHPDFLSYLYDTSISTFSNAAIGNNVSQKFQPCVHVDWYIIWQIENILFLTMPRYLGWCYMKVG